MTPQPRFGEFATPEEQRDQMNGPDAEKASVPAVDQPPRRPSFGERVEEGDGDAAASAPADPESVSAPNASDSVSSVSAPAVPTAPASSAPRYGERVAEGAAPAGSEHPESAAADGSPTRAEPRRPTYGERVDPADAPQQAPASPSAAPAAGERVAASQLPPPEYGERVAASQLPPPEYGERVTASQLPPPEYGERTTDAPVYAQASSTPAAPADGIPRYAAGSFSGVTVGNRPATQTSTPADARAGSQAGNGVNRAGAPSGGAPKRPAAGRANDGLPVQAPPDRFISLILLAFGAFSILTSVPALLNLREAFVEYFKELGISGDSLGQSINVSGWVMAAIMIAVWCLSAWWTMRRIRAGKSSWWIPLLGAVVALLVMSMILAPVMGNDPAFQEYVRRFQP
ncbi:hypothetical protein D9V34_01110 [Mycetocola lacteus]|uniref:Uncharacterized protein n=1 Tax=Mycetocola lacteus TaxID=76637 RepID=A0A3L7ALL5_9MICO|nr:DUF6264 family protein [Mycetocola lacteus]RLP80845.1 hypothetical protein D9V34_13405 [Mycetocola lacteus]RLP84630.1 hypothetical protein D9V34_01110 [Mycetocola lacteus]